MFPTLMKSTKSLRVLLLVLAAAVASIAQDSASPGQLNEAQAQALLKKLSSAPAAARPLTAAEINKLLQYVSDQAKQQVAAQKPKKVRVGIVMPQANLGPGFSGDAVGGPLRDLIAHYLSGPMMELVALDARVSQQVDAEAQSKQCAFVLYTSASQKKTGGNGLGMFKGATTMANMMPMVQAAKVTGGMMSAAGSAANAAASAQEAAALSKAIKAKNEVSLKYKLQNHGNPAASTNDILNDKGNASGAIILLHMLGQY